jgi:rare lipoprotein A
MLEVRIHAAAMSAGRSRRRAAMPVLCGALLLAAGCAHRSRVAIPPPRTAPAARVGATETGVASWYGPPYHGRMAASGEIYDMEQRTAAHRTLPFETWVRVTNLSNQKQVDVRIVDRGPFVDGRIIDLSLAAARDIDMVRSGTARVRLKVIAPAKAPGLDALKSGYAVQAGVFSDRGRAEALRGVLHTDAVRIVETSGDRRLWKVLVGHSLNRDAAAALASKVREIAGEALVVPDGE